MSLRINNSEDSSDPKTFDFESTPKQGALIDIEAGSYFSREADGPGDSLDFSASLADGSELPDWIQIDPQSGRVTGTPPHDLNTSIEISVTANDAPGASVSTVFTVQIVYLKTVPEPAAPAEEATAPQTAGFHFDVSSSFADSGLADTLTFSATLPDGTPLPAWLTFDTANGVFTGFPEPDDVGMIPVAVIASDGKKSAQDMFAIMVQNTDGGAVALGISNQKKPPAQRFSLDVSSSFSHLDTQNALTYSVSLINGSDLPEWLEFDESTGMFSGIPEKENVGELSLLVVASDGKSNANAMFSIEVEDTGKGAVAKYLPPQAIDETSQYLFDASIAFSGHGQQDEVAYSATLESGDPLPSWISINRFTGELAATSAKIETGTLSIAVTASNSEAAATSTCSISVQKTDNGSIVAVSIFKRTIVEVAEDSADSEQIESVDLPDATENAEVDFLPTAPIDSDAFSIQGANTDEETSIATTWSLSIGEDATFSLDAASSFSDTDLGEALAFEAALDDGSPLPQWLVFDETAGRFAGSPSDADVGSFEITVVATDGESVLDRRFSITVENGNCGPLARFDSDSTQGDDDYFVSENVIHSREGAVSSEEPDPCSFVVDLDRANSVSYSADDDHFESEASDSSEEWQMSHDGAADLRRALDSLLSGKQ